MCISLVYVVWIGHILWRKCLLKQVIEGKIKGVIEVTRRRGRRRRKVLDDLKDRRVYSHLKEEALDRTMWRNRFGGGFGPVVRQNTEWLNIVWMLKTWYKKYYWNYILSYTSLFEFVGKKYGLGFLFEKEFLILLWSKYEEVVLTGCGQCNLIGSFIFGV